MGKKVEAYECPKCGAVFKTEEEANNCNKCMIGFCPHWGFNIKRSTCDECYEKRATGAGSFMKPVEGKDPKEPGGLEKVVYSGIKCEYRADFLENLGKTKPDAELPEDAKKILEEMKKEAETNKPLSAEEAAKLVREKKGIIGDPHSQT